MIYADAPNTDWEKNSTTISITEQNVTHDQMLYLALVGNGGVAITFMPLP